MDDKEITQIGLRDILQFCRAALNDINENSLATALREQNERFDKALNTIERIIPAAENVAEQGAPEVGIRAATIFMTGLWSRLKQGRSVEELTVDDWNGIMGAVYDHAAMMDPQDYSLLVFDLYRKSIAFAIEPMRPNASPDVINRLEEIVSTMDEYADDLKDGTISEVKYIEESLWLSLEAVMLVMTDRMSLALLPAERRELAEAVGALVFQKFRYSHYDEELTAINEMLEHQGKLDKELTEQLNAYIDSLKDELDEFDMLTERAFNSEDFQSAFRGSADLADSLGIGEILYTTNDIDNYFMS